MRSMSMSRFLSSPSLRSFGSFPFPLLFSSSSSNSSSTHAQPELITSKISTTSLTQEELTQINLLIPRLCSSNQLKEATNLITTALLTNPSLKSLSLSIFIHRLSLEPDLTQPMYFLNRLKYSPNQDTFLIPILKMLVSCYFNERKQPKMALKIMNWISRPDFPCTVDFRFCAVLVNGFCKNYMALEALKVLRMMVIGNLKVGDELRVEVYRCLLREARIVEAQKLDEALKCVESRNKEDDEVVALIDSMISNWVEEI